MEDSVAVGVAVGAGGVGNVDAAQDAGSAFYQAV
jgi:hypothetical protein